MSAAADMTENERQAYALAQRENCCPTECVRDPYECWSLYGGLDRLLSPANGAPRCAACKGKILIEEWRTPAGFKLPPHGRLLPPRRPRGSDSRPG